MRADALPRRRLQRGGAGPARLDPLLRLCGPYRGRSAHGPRRGRCRRAPAGLTWTLSAPGDQARLTLRAQGDELRAEAAVLREQTPFGEALRCGEGWGQGLAFDHGEILLTALLRLR